MHRSNTNSSDIFPESLWMATAEFWASRIANLLARWRGVRIDAILASMRRLALPARE